MIQVFRPIPAERLKLLIFDLDGTLIDSAQDLCNSVNAALKAFDYEPLPDATIAGFVGNGAPMLMRRSLALAKGIPPEAVKDELFEKAYQFFIDYYREHNLDFTSAYAGVLDALQALKELHGRPGSIAQRKADGVARVMAVLTNKPVRPARAICEGLGLAGYFLHIRGGDSFPAKKPDPEGLRALMKETGAAPEETAMIGDSAVDMQTARNAGAWALGCDFGFGPQNLMDVRPDVVVDSAEEWVRVLNTAGGVVVMKR